MYLFRPHEEKDTRDTKKPRLQQQNSGGGLFAWAKERRGASHKPGPKVVPKPCKQTAEVTPNINFRYNPLHDLESTWWNGYSFLLNMEIGVPSGENGRLTFTKASNDQYLHRSFG